MFVKFYDKMLELVTEKVKIQIFDASARNHLFHFTEAKNVRTDEKKWILSSVKVQRH